MPPVITLTSDWKNGDYYTAALKGRLLRLDAALRLELLSDHVAPHDAVQAAFVLAHSGLHFPPGTLHLCAVSFETDAQRPLGIFFYKEQYFIAPDDGRFALLLSFMGGADTVPQTGRFYHLLPELTPLGGAERVYAYPFQALPLLVTAVQAVLEQKLDLWCRPAHPHPERPSQPACDPDSIVAKVMYIDSYGNAVTNITFALFERMCANRRFEIFVNGPRVKVTRFSPGYRGLRPGELFALFNSLGLLELGVYLGDLARQESKSLYSEIRIKFYDNP